MSAAKFIPKNLSDQVIVITDASSRIGLEMAKQAAAKGAVAAQPLLGIYSSSKEALKAFTDALRSELRDKDIPVEVCLLRPASISDENPVDTAAAVLKCAEHPQRDVYVGGPARLSAILDTFFPQVKDMVAETKMKEMKKEETEDSSSEITTLGVLKTLKDNLKSSLKEIRKNDSH